MGKNNFLDLLEHRKSRGAEMPVQEEKGLIVKLRKVTIKRGDTNE